MIYVIGSGFSSLAAVLTLLKFDMEVTVIDVGKKFDNTEQILVKNLLNTNNVYEIINYINKFKDINQNIYSKIISYKSKFGSQFFRENSINEVVEKQNNTNINMSYAYGGFSNIWGAACLPILREEITDWPINYQDLSKYFFLCSEILNINGEEDSLNDFF